MQAEILGRIGAIIASDQEGEVLALHVVQVPQQLSLGDGRLFLKESRPMLDESDFYGLRSGMSLFTRSSGSGERYRRRLG